MFFKSLLFLSSVLAIVACSSKRSAEILLTNGIIYDGSGNPPISGDVAISGDSIVAFGDLADWKSKEKIDLQGMAIAPGFINMLSWANVSLIEDGRSQSDIRQGVTLEVMGEGTSMGPLTGEMKQEMLDDQVDIKFDVAWITLGEYLQYLESKGVSTNVASFVGNGTLRRHVIGYENRPATSDELEQMKALLDQSMKEGAVGLSSSLLYAPSGYASTDELIELSKVASAYGGMYISHIRSEGDELYEAIEEVLQISKEAEINAEIYHLKASGVDNWSKMDSAIMMIENARADGLPITADVYTYPASSTGLHVQLPDWVREGGIEAMIRLLKEPALRWRAIQELEFEHKPDRILLVGFKNPELRVHAGKRLNELADEWNISPEQAVVDLIVKDDSRVQVVYFSMSEANMAKKIAQPWVSFCSDAGSYSAEGVFLKQSTHPRAYGSFVRVLGKYSRDEQVLSLQEAIRKLSALPAQNLSLMRRGMIKVGYFADLVVFDPKEVNDRATFEEPHQYAVGVKHVWVNGVQVLNDGEHTGKTPGRFVKGPGAVN